MIRLENVNKYFNKKKKNEIHVINETSLDFDKKGLVGLLGPSGCGKTTLLNVIGGLDKVNSGDIYVNGERLTRRRSGKIDEIRNLNIGYIFQNYNLVDELTVFDNVAMVLKMIGVRSKSEIRSKVNYALEMVGMYRYRNRFADMLSGGERQRVGIARAIVKNPHVIIADEPTGNLDSRNTIDVMNIIKSISRTRLVILVTHEEELVKFYCSRIVRISDGKVISDEANENADDLDYRIDNNIYLDDIKSHNTVETDKGTIQVYSDQPEAADLNIVIRGGNIYIQSVNKNYRTEVLDSDAGIQLVEGKYKEMTEADFFAHQFDPRKLRRSGEAKYSSILSLREMFKAGFKKVRDYKAIKKVLLVGFFVSAMFAVYSLSNIAGVLHVDDSKFISVNKGYLKIVKKNIRLDEYKEYEAIDGVQYVMPGTSKVNFQISYDDFYQTNGKSGTLSGSLTSINNIQKKDLVAGRMPKNKEEIVIDKLVANRLIKGKSEMEEMPSTAPAAGINTATDLLGRKAKIKGMKAMTIVGLTNKVNPCIYASESQFLDIIAGSMSDDDSQMYNEGGAPEDAGGDDGGEGKLVDYNDYNFDGGIKPTGDYQVVVSEMKQEEMPLNKLIDKKVNGHKLKVVGYFKDEDGSNLMLVNTKTLEESVIGGKSGITIYARNKDYIKSQLKDLGANVEDPYQKSRDKYMSEKQNTIRSALILALAVLAISIIEIFLIMRASFMSRIREVGVYRAIGVKKRDIRKMFLGEVFAVTILADVPGIILMSYIVSRLQTIAYLAPNYIINPLIVVGATALLFFVNIFFGLLPVSRLLRKTPAEILARNDAGK